MRQHELAVRSRPLASNLTGERAPVTAEAAERSAASERIGTAANEPVSLASDGAVEAPRFVFGEPRTVTVAVGAASFQVTPTSEEDVWEVAADGFGYVKSIPDAVASVNLVAQVPRLPLGATITDFTCRYVDTASDGQATFSFTLRKSFNQLGLEVATCSITTINTGSAVGLAVAPTIERPDVGGFASRYFVTGRWDPSQVGGGLRFYGCSIDLEVPELVP